MQTLWRDRPEWIVVLAGVSAALHVGKLSPALPLLQTELGVTLVQAGFLLSMVQLAGMLLGLVVGLSADRVGYRRCMLSGLLVLGTASLAGGAAAGVAALLAWRAVEGMGFLLVCMPAPALIRRLVSASRLRPVLGIWGAYMPLGTALALLCGPIVLQGPGWRVWWWLLAAVSLLLAWWVWHAIPEDSSHRSGRSHHDDSTPGTPALCGWSARLRHALAHEGVWLVALAFAVYSGQWLAVVGFLPSVLAGCAYSGMALAVPLALVAAVNMIGNIAAGQLLARGVPPQQLLVGGYCVMAAGSVLAFYGLQGAQGCVTDAGWRFAGVVGFSMFGGLIPATLFYLAVTVSPGESTVATTVGWMQQWSALGQFVGPPLIAWVAAQAGSWRWTWCITAAVAMVGVLLSRRLAVLAKA